MSSALTLPRHTSTSQAVALAGGQAHSCSQNAHHAAPAGEDVWHDSDAPIPQHSVSTQSAGAIGCLHDVLAVHLAGHVSGYASRSGCRDEHIAGNGEQLLQRQLLTCRQWRAACGRTWMQWLGLQTEECNFLLAGTRGLLWGRRLCMDSTAACLPAAAHGRQHFDNREELAR